MKNEIVERVIKKIMKNVQDKKNGTISFATYVDRMGEIHSTMDSMCHCGILTYDEWYICCNEFYANL